MNCLGFSFFGLVHLIREPEEMPQRDQKSPEGLLSSSTVFYSWPEFFSFFSFFSLAGVKKSPSLREKLLIKSQSVAHTHSENSGTRFWVPKES